ncbi:peptidoglycan DD-metalloendopeptidase family protein [Candidatus Parcubacteria bacterium]|nr:peptidoglycan DD-metalloendopeptidase family protein [Candidatus Parcubacteria bacterium]
MKFSFREHRLLHVTTTALNKLRKNAGAAPIVNAKAEARAGIKQETERRATVEASSREQDRQISNNNARGDVTMERMGSTKQQYMSGVGTALGPSPVKVSNTKSGQSKIWYASSEQKRSVERGRQQGKVEQDYADWYNSELNATGYVDPRDAAAKRQEMQGALDSEWAAKDKANDEGMQGRLAKRKDLQNPTKQGLKTAAPPAAKAKSPYTPGQSATKPYQVNDKTRPGTTVDQRSTERGNMRKTPGQRLGFTAPVQVAPGQVPSKTYPEGTPRQQEAAGALQGDTLDTPDTLSGLVDEEQSAIDPLMGAMGVIRDGFKIYQKEAQGLLNDRGKQIENYKQEGQDRSEQIADLKIDQSKSNRDLELELIAESRDRARRDEMLAQEKNDIDYDREEDRIIGENQGRIERLETSLGARYGGFGSGKGLANIQSARDEGTEVLRQLNEDRIYTRQESVNALDDIEKDWKLARKESFNRHDQNVTNAYTAMMEAAQNIDDNALTEEGDKMDKGLQLLKDSFDTLDKIWTKTGEELSNANRRALDKRDELRKENQKNQQDAMANIFSGLNVLPSSSPFFRNLEKKAGLTPGTIASTKSNEERRIAISEANLRISQKQLDLQIKEFERDGGKIDTAASKLLGRVVTDTGETFHDALGNPVYITGEGGSVTSSTYNDAKLFGEASVGMGTTVNFSRYALSLGDIVPGSPYHKGGEYDVDNVAGTPIPPLSGGTVTKVGFDEGYGNYVDIFDGTNTVRYAHLEKALVKEGDFVNGYNSGNGQIVGLMGNTGNVMGMDGHRPSAGDMQTGSHLHIEMRTGQDFSSGAVVDLMNAGMQPGQMHTGNVVWVDDMRTKIRGTSDTPWVEVDSQIMELAKDVFRDPEGKTDWAAVETVFDYMNGHKMGQYELSYTGQGSVQGSYQASKEIEYNRQVHGRSNVVADREMVSKGFVDPETFLESLSDGTLGEMTDSAAKQYMYDMGYVVEEGWFGHSVRQMNADEIDVLNQRRAAIGLPPLE